MILYFADRQMNILGQATTGLPSGLTVISDKKTEDVDIGVAIFEATLCYDSTTRDKIEKIAAAGNYILRKSENEAEFFTIIETESDTKKQQMYIYAEDAGMDLLNEVVPEYEADAAHPISFYIEKYVGNSGFQIGINEAASLTRQLSWDSESTAAERILSVATQFDNCEISYSFEIEGLYVTKKYINIHKQRGKDIGASLRLGQEVDGIITTKSIANLATALYCTGGTPDPVEDEKTGESVEQPPITLEGYTYDDGDVYVDGAVLKSREALKTWARLLWKTDGTQKAGGHITKRFNYDTLEQSELCNRAITELKKLRDMEVNYEADIQKLPDNIGVGDRVNIIDHEGGLFLSTRLLTIETSVIDCTRKAVLGDHIIKHNGIAQKVADLAEQFARASVSASRALAIADAAKRSANAAKEQASQAASESTNAKNTANEAITQANAAAESAAQAQAQADAAQSAVETVQESVESLETTVDNAQAAADQAQAAAATAQEKATEAKEAATQAQADATKAAQDAGTAKTQADTAIAQAGAAQATADQAKTDAQTASETATAAKQDAQAAQDAIDALGDDLTTLESTMEADYARKTDLTEATASLQTQITQNAAEISSTASRVQTIDETANSAAAQAQAAQTTATAAQAQADAASANAQAAQTAAEDAQAAATNAQSEADKAKTAAEDAQEVADKAKADLEAAQADLATVSGRVDATEEEIRAAQEAVATAQAAADDAQADATAAAQAASAAQSTAATAATNAATAQQTANGAASAANLAQQAADAAKGDAAAAQQAADQAAQQAAEAQRTASAAQADAATAQTRADEAAQAASEAQQAADDADAKAAQAAEDLATAQENLAAVTSRVGATEEEIAAAQQAVETAQSAADQAKADALTAQQTADQAKTNAATAQAAADDAQQAADDAQQAADDAQQAADRAQADVNALAVRVTTAETKITQNAEQIALRATKTEVEETLGGYYTKAEADAAITVKANEIKSEVANEIAEIEIGGRNLLLESGIEATNNNYCIQGYVPSSPLVAGEEYTLTACFTPAAGVDRIQAYLSGGYVLIGTIETTDAIRQTGHFTFTASYTDGRTPDDDAAFANIRVYRQPNDETVTDNSTIHWIKVEKGNKSTDWTPAPEDVDSEIKQTDDALRQAITEQNTSLVQTCESLIFAAAETLVKTSDYDVFRETVAAQLSVLSDEISMKFTAAEERINAIDGDLQAEVAERSKHISFSEDGVQIRAGENAMQIRIDNDIIVFEKNGTQFGWWDGIDFHTGNIVIDVTERAQFGNFAFVPRSDGSLSFLKVGG